MEWVLVSRRVQTKTCCPSCLLKKAVVLHHIALSKFPLSQEESANLPIIVCIQPINSPVWRRSRLGRWTYMYALASLFFPFDSEKNGRFGVKSRDLCFSM